MINSHFAYQYVYDRILDCIVGGELREGGCLLSEKEYCQKFDVSLTTVRRALDKLKQENVVEKIQGKGTVVSDKVRGLRLPFNKYIGVMMVAFREQSRPQTRYGYNNLYAHKIYKSVYRELNGEYNLLIDTLKEDELETAFPSSVLNRADKIFIIGETRRGVIDYLHAQGKYVAVYNFFDNDVAVCRINNDERAKFRQAVEYFIGKGHRRIASVGGANNFSESLERYMGYQDALIAHDVYIDSQYVKWGDMTPESGYERTKELLRLRDRPTCVVCVNDGVAMGAYDAIAEIGLTPNRDIVLIGHDNSELPDPKYVFTTIDPHYERIGKLLADRLRRNIWIDDEIIERGELLIRDRAGSPEKELV